MWERKCWGSHKVDINPTAPWHIVCVMCDWASKQWATVLRIMLMTWHGVQLFRTLSRSSVFPVCCWSHPTFSKFLRINSSPLTCSLSHLRIITSLYLFECANVAEICYLIIGLRDRGMNKHERAGAGSGKWGWWVSECANAGGYANAVEMRCKWAFFPLKCTDPLGARIKHPGCFSSMRGLWFEQCTGRSCGVVLRGPLIIIWKTGQKKIQNFLNNYTTPVATTFLQQGWSTSGILKMLLAVNWERIRGVLAFHYVSQRNQLPLPAFDSSFYCDYKSAFLYGKDMHSLFWPQEVQAICL